MLALWAVSALRLSDYQFRADLERSGACLGRPFRSARGLPVNLPLGFCASIFVCALFAPALGWFLAGERRGWDLPC